MIKIPQLTHKQFNNSDRTGTIWASKNINLDEAKYIKLSPRMVRIMDESVNSDFGVPLSIGKYGQGSFQIATSSDANFTLVIDSNGAVTITEESGANEPTLTIRSHAKFFEGRWFATTTTAIVSKASNGAANAAWTDSSITLANSGVRHYMEVFASRVSLVVADKNILKQYTNSSGTLTNTINLTIPTDYEINGVAYNYGKMGVITRVATSGASGISEAKFYIWDGSVTSAVGFGLGSDAGILVLPYKSSFLVLTRNGKWKYFNGGGFEELEGLPFFYEGKKWAQSGDETVFGDAFDVDEEKVYFNLGLLLNSFYRKGYKTIVNAPSGVWCRDPEVGIYHRLSPSNSTLGVFTVTDSNVNTGTDVLTASSGTIPATGNIARYIRTDGTEIGGLKLAQDYFIIKTGSTTFKLAETKEYALNNVAIDITTTGGSNNFFHMYTLNDYGQTLYEDSGAIASFGEGGQVPSIYGDYLVGSILYDTALSGIPNLSMVVPFLENRGWIITPKIFPDDAVEDTYQKLTIKFKPLKTDDKIIVKVRTKNILGLPISSPNKESSDFATWSSATEFYTSTDLSEAKTALDKNQELECELVAGAGAGVMVKISSISAPSAGVTSVVLAEEVLGASSGLKSYFIIDNWEVLQEADSEDDYYKSYIVSRRGKWVQFKVELRGDETTIEEMQLDHVTKKKE